VQFARLALREDPADPSDYAGQLLTIADDGDLQAVGRAVRKPGDFRDPQWSLIKDVEEFVGCEVKEWPRGEYTAANIAGPPGERLRLEVEQQVRKASDDVSALIQEHS
jgi:hypothetical protein